MEGGVLPPSIPAAAKDRLTLVGAMDSRGKFTSKDRKNFDSELAKIDWAALMSLTALCYFWLK